MESKSPIKRDIPNVEENEETNIGGEVDTVRFQWYHVNFYSLPAKFSYAMEACRRLSYSPHLVLFLTGIGLSEAESGYIMGFRLLGMLTGGPFWGVIADKWKCHRSVITIMCVMSILLMCSQPFVTLGYSDPSINRCPYNEAVIMNSVANCSTFQNCTEKFFSNSTALPNTQQRKHENSKLFFIMLFMCIAAAFAEGSSIAFVDTGTIRRIQLSKHREIDYGRQTMWSAVGASIGSVTASIVIEYFPPANVNCYSGIFVTYIVYTILLALCLLYLYRGLSFTDKNDEDHNLPLKSKPSQEEKNAHRVIKESVYKTLREILSHFDILFLYTTTFVCGMLYSVYFSFFFLYLKDLQGSPTLFSLTIPFAAIGGFVGFFVSIKIIKKIGGTWRAIALSVFGFAVRYLGFGLVSNPWLVLVFQLLHGLTYSLFLTAGVMHLKETSPVSVITTMVSTFNSIYFGVGPIIGTSISGIIYGKYGGSVLFCGSAAIASFWCALVILYIILRKKPEKAESC